MKGFLMSFPTDFTWGVATSAYQVEGAASKDGKGLSVWDTFCMERGRIWKNQTGNTACDHYDRYEEDVKIMKRMGIKGYRFSVSWARVLPDGLGKLNEKAFDFYRRLTDLLNQAGIEPWVTLFHWDYPHELYLKGGWLNPDSSNWFAEYARSVCEGLGDKVSHWITLNEPQCFLELGHRAGTHAPGLKLPFKEVLCAGHNVLLGHGKAVQAMRSVSGQKCRIGFSPVAILRLPQSGSEADVAAARKVTLSVQGDDCWNNTWWMDPVYLGKYPEGAIETYGDLMPRIKEKDLATIHQPLDFFGVNIYTGHRVRAGEDGSPVEIIDEDGCPTNMLGWPIVPDAVYWGPRFLYERYGLPIVITENGMSNVDIVSLDGKVHDPQRIDFMRRYISEIERATNDGIDIIGYFHWSLMDNFEWTWGYKERFGLVYVDYKTQKRIIKDSGLWYEDFIREQGKKHRQ